MHYDNYYPKNTITVEINNNEKFKKKRKKKWIKNSISFHCIIKMAISIKISPC